MSTSRLMERSNPLNADGSSTNRASISTQPSIRQAVIVTLEERLGAGPISWGVCEVPGWGRMLSADRVLREMRSVGITATELGAPGFLPHDASALRAELDRLDV